MLEEEMALTDERLEALSEAKDELEEEVTRLDKEKSGVEKGILTNMHIDMDYETLISELPSNVEPAYDGMKLMSSHRNLKE